MLYDKNTQQIELSECVLHTKNKIQQAAWSTYQNYEVGTTITPSNNNKHLNSYCNIKFTTVISMYCV